LKSRVIFFFSLCFGASSILSPKGCNYAPRSSAAAPLESGFLCGAWFFFGRRRFASRFSSVPTRYARRYSPPSSWSTGVPIDFLRLLATNPGTPCSALGLQPLHSIWDSCHLSTLNRHLYSLKVPTGFPYFLFTRFRCRYGNLSLSTCPPCFFFFFFLFSSSREPPMFPPPTRLMAR